MGVKSAVKEEFRFINHPLTVKQMAAQINAASDAYISMKITENDLRALLHHYAKNYGTRMFATHGVLNPTIRKIIGKRRSELVINLLAGFQFTFF